MGRKKANCDIKEFIVPMREDAMNPPENFDTSQVDSENSPDYDLRRLPSDNTK